jgi:hypothetical protein
MRYAWMVIVLVVVFTAMGLVAAFGTMFYLQPLADRDEIVPIVFGSFPLGGAAVGLAVGIVAATVGLVSDYQRAKRESPASSDRSPLEV